MTHGAEWTENPTAHIENYLKVNLIYYVLNFLKKLLFDPIH